MAQRRQSCWVRLQAPNNCAVDMFKLSQIASWRRGSTVFGCPCFQAATAPANGGGCCWFAMGPGRLPRWVVLGLGPAGGWEGGAWWELGIDWDRCWCGVKGGGLVAEGRVGLKKWDGIEPARSLNERLPFTAVASQDRSTIGRLSAETITSSHLWRKNVAVASVT